MESRVCRIHAPHDLRVETEAVTEPGPGQVLVAVGAGGICGSDLHYYHAGGFGTVRLREPMILGHEVAGTVTALGGGVTALAEGDRVALNPSHPCGSCDYCSQGAFNHCTEMRFYGSAMRFPHVQGAFRDLILVDAAQCETVGPGTTLAEAACAEPLAVCLHAAARAGALSGKRVLVTGAGPIGALCAAAARHHGAAEIVVTDLQDATLAVAARMGATRTVNVSGGSEAMEPFLAGKGHFDVTIECSGASPAVRTAIAATRPQGTIVQVGLAGELALPINLLVGKEIALKGTFRFHPEFAEAVRLVDSGAIDVKPIITGRYP
ncbi:MAG TPA: L-idonate 5-dehydrogenase, partial [Thermohalobaculum sp.]|nr:L-idonate 5-dehydrogenase [Thermohalobaculum sp.]